MIVSTAPPSLLMQWTIPCSCHVQAWFRKTVAKQTSWRGFELKKLSRVTLVERRGEGERQANSFLSKLLNMSTFFWVTPNVVVGTRQQQEPEAAVIVSRGGDEVESDISDAFHHKDVSIKAVEMINYIKYWLMFLSITVKHWDDSFVR